MPARGHAPAKTRFWSQHIKAWEASGLQQKEYCAKNRLGLKSFGRWKRIFEQQANCGQAPESSRTIGNTGGMVPLSIFPESPQNDVSEKAQAAGLRLYVGERYVISVSIGFHAPTLQTLLGALG